jgi:hypothetical protein
MELTQTKERLNKYLKTSFHQRLFSAAISNLEDTPNILRFNNFAYALRELLRNVFAYHSPDEDVVAASWYKNETRIEGGVTRRQRVHYMLHGGVEKSFFSEILQAKITNSIKSVLDNIGSLSKFTHIGPDTFDIKAKEISDKSAAVLESVLHIFELIAVCREEIEDYLVDELDSAVRTALTVDVYDAIDNAERTVVNEVVMDNFSITTIDSNFIHLGGNGTVAYEVLYGTESEFGKEDDEVGSFCVHFPFSGKTSVSKFNDIEIYAQTFTEHETATQRKQEDNEIQSEKHTRENEAFVSAALVRDITNRHIKSESVSLVKRRICAWCQNELSIGKLVRLIRNYDGTKVYLCNEECLKGHEAGTFAAARCKDLEDIPLLNKNVRISRHELIRMYEDRFAASQQDRTDSVLRKLGHL